MKHAQQFYTCPMHDSVAATKPHCSSMVKWLELSKKEAMKTQVTKNIHAPRTLAEVSDKPGKCSKCGKNLTLCKENMKVDVMNNYTCPMYAGDFTSDVGLGKCPNCGMTLTKVKNKAKGKE